MICLGYEDDQLTVGTSAKCKKSIEKQNEDTFGISKSLIVEEDL